MLGEDVENECFPVHYVALEDPLQISLLCRGEGMIEDHDVDIEGTGQTSELIGFSRADVRRRVDPVSLDQFRIHRIRSCCVG